MSTIAEQIDEIRRQWGNKLVILGHHYQRPSVLQHADILGDSLELARRARAESVTERIVFCGVHFMAESACVLAAEHQSVYMPDVSAGCPMADMADIEQMEAALARISQVESGWVPVAYVNSTADIKACFGRNAGMTVTSGIAPRVLQSIFDQGKKVLFLPDQHLGENSAIDLGMDASEVAVYDPVLPEGGLSDAQVRSCKMLVWKGYCIVHVGFTLDQIGLIRQRYPEARIIVHPETPKEVVKECDAHGSTAQIIRYVEEAAEGSMIFIGTEFNLVNRLAEQYKGRLEIRPLKPSVCTNMARTTPEKLLELLQTWPEQRKIEVDSRVAAEARVALERMLAVG
jgi:quinolinate synthase